jgi:hypothetical protein
MFSTNFFKIVAIFLDDFRSFRSHCCCQLITLFNLSFLSIILVILYIPTKLIILPYTSNTAHPHTLQSHLSASPHLTFPHHNLTPPLLLHTLHTQLHTPHTQLHTPHTQLLHTPPTHPTKHTHTPHPTPHTLHTTHTLGHA